MMNVVRIFFIMTFMTGVLYPLGVTLLSQLLFAEKSQGSLVKLDGKVVGSSLIAQKFSRADLFHPRPSAADFATVPSGASQVSPTHKEGQERILRRRSEFSEMDVDFWTTSSSGLDPHITPSTAYGQIRRVAAAKKLSASRLKKIVDQSIEPSTFGIWGQPRVNVLGLNIAVLKEMNVHTRSAPSKP